MALRQAAWLLLLGTCAALLLPAPAAGDETSSWRQAVDRMADEKRLAEGCASLLKALADSDPMQRVQGQRIYARARADADGLTALLKADLAGDRSPAAIPELRYRLESVPKQRHALCTYVEAALASVRRAPGERSGALELLAKEAAGPAMSLVDAAVELWGAYRRAGAEDRERIVSALEATRWREYAEVSSGE